MHGNPGTIIVERMLDFDLDGIEDYAVLSRPFVVTATGRVDVHSGASGAVLLTVLDPHPIEGIHCISDVDGDTVPELIINSTWAGAGWVDVVSGASGTSLHRTMGMSIQYFGYRVEPLGDLDGNGSPEIMIVSRGQPLLGGGLPVIASESIYTVTSGGLVLQSSTPNSRFPTRIGDVDADGVEDFVLSRPISLGPNYPVEVILHSGATLSPLVTYVFPGSISFGFGSWVGSVGDVDGDGILDVGVMAIQNASPLGLGATVTVYVYAGLSGVLIHQVEAGTLSAGGGAGSFDFDRISGGGDCDGDGMTDFVVGFPHFAYTGVVRIYRGAAPFSPYSAAGNVNANGPGGVVDVLDVGTAPFSAPIDDGAARTVILPVGSPLALWMTQPPANAGTVSPFLIFGHYWPAPNHAAVPLPFDVGAMSFLPSPLDPGDVFGFTFADAWGGGSGLVPAVPAFAPSPGATAAITPAIPIPLTFALQGIIYDASAPWPGISVTNAVRVIVR